MGIVSFPSRADLELVGMGSSAAELLRHGWLIGGLAARGRWLKDREVARQLRGGEEYRLFGLQGPVGMARGRRPEVSPGIGIQEVELVARPETTSAQRLIGLSGADGVNPQPRLPAAVEPTLALAVRAAAALSQRGVPRGDVRITGALRVDVDGDGEEDWLSVAASAHVESSLDPAEVRANDYSAVLYARGAAGPARLVAGWFAARAPRGQAPAQYTIDNLLDLDGDGALELIAEWHYYEGGGVDVYRLSGGKPRLVLATEGGL